MGICSSGESTSVATAKLILQDGHLHEFSNPVKVSHVLNTIKISPTTCFVCDSDDMDLGTFVRGVDMDAELQVGHLYFVLPLSWLNKPLQAEQMAVLAVRGSLALRNMRQGKRCMYFGSCGCKRVNEVVFSIKKEVNPSRLVVIGGGHREVVSRRRGRGGGGRHRRGSGGGDSFRTRSLSVILEDDDDMIEDRASLCNVPMLNV